MIQPDETHASSQPEPWPEPRRHGEATAVLFITEIRPWWVPILRLEFWFSTRFPIVARRLHLLSFIHFARWTVLSRLPGRPGRPGVLRPPRLIFESNYNGGFDDYFDAFCYVVPDRIYTIWRGAYRWTGLRPVDRMKRWVAEEDHPNGHYYCAYPDATTTTIKSALASQRLFAEFAAQIAGTDSMVEPDDFRTAYHQFLADVQHHL